ncbi:MAG: N-acetylmuramoyl-L-alanine amidase [Phycisphaerales bacterium]|nr:N-acetylmuramoyl-L-alanine amidase [Phycisphaerales bacterium]
MLILRLLVGLVLLLQFACASRVGERLPRRGDEIVIAGQYFHTGTPVVLWTDPGGYDAYRVERRFAPIDQASWEASKEKIATPNRYGTRRVPLSPEAAEQVRGGGWELDLLRQHVDQFVIHYDVCGTSRTCFQVLHDQRCLSVHFMLDIDGTIYQTLDVKERAWHATTANDRAVGIEIANIGAYPPGKPSPLDSWYATDAAGPYVTLPSRLGDGGVRTKGFIARPARSQRIAGDIHGVAYEMYDLTPQQYESLARLTATLCRVLPGLACDYPRDAQGDLVARAMTPDELAAHRGLLGHFHITKGKIDPGPAFDWDKVVRRARALGAPRSISPRLAP